MGTASVTDPGWPTGPGGQYQLGASQDVYSTPIYSGALASRQVGGNPYGGQMGVDPFTGALGSVAGTTLNGVTIYQELPGGAAHGLGQPGGGALFTAPPEAPPGYLSGYVDGGYGYGPPPIYGAGSPILQGNIQKQQAAPINVSVDSRSNTYNPANPTPMQGGGGQPPNWGSMNLPMAQQTPVTGPAPRFPYQNGPVANPVSFQPMRGPGGGPSGGGGGMPYGGPSGGPSPQAASITFESGGGTPPGAPQTPVTLPHMGGMQAMMGGGAAYPVMQGGNPAQMAQGALQQGGPPTAAQRPPMTVPQQAQGDMNLQRQYANEDGGQTAPSGWDETPNQPEESAKVQEKQRAAAREAQQRELGLHPSQQQSNNAFLDQARSVLNSATPNVDANNMPDAQTFEANLNKELNGIPLISQAKYEGPQQRLDARIQYTTQKINYANRQLGQIARRINQLMDPYAMRNEAAANARGDYIAAKGAQPHGIGKIFDIGSRIASAAMAPNVAGMRQALNPNGSPDEQYQAYARREWDWLNGERQEVMPELNKLMDYAQKMSDSAEKSYDELEKDSIDLAKNQMADEDKLYDNILTKYKNLETLYKDQATDKRMQTANALKAAEANIKMARAQAYDKHVNALVGKLSQVKGDSDAMKAMKEQLMGLKIKGQELKNDFYSQKNDAYDADFERAKGQSMIDRNEAIAESARGGAPSKEDFISNLVDSGVPREQAEKAYDMGMKARAR